MFGFIYWIAGAVVLSCAISTVFGGWLGLKRNLFLLLYVPISVIFIYFFYRWNEINLQGQIVSNWYWGLVAAAGAGIIAVRNVLKQKPYPRRKGRAFLLDIMWPGLAYGAIDGLLLSVVPITAVYRGLAGMEWTTGAFGEVGIALIALLASLTITLFYHLGYPEFRGRQVAWTLIGNGLFSLAFLVSGNPLAAVLPHIAMHIAAITHGRETSIQLPPHQMEIAENTASLQR